MSTALATRIIPPLSQSRYELLACPASYVEQVIRGNHEPPNPFSIRGTVVHNRLSAYVNHLVQSRLTDDAETFAQLIADVTGEAREILNRMRGLKVDPDRVLGTELLLSLDENFNRVNIVMEDGKPCSDGAVAYQGTPDLLEAPDATTIEITDYKTYFAIVPVDTYQSRHYPLLVFQHYPDVQIVRFHLNFVRFGVSDFVEYQRDRDLPKLMAEARAARKRQIQLHEDYATDGRIDAMPHPGCVYCPLLTNGCQIQNNPYNEAPEELAKFVMWAEQARKKALGLLKDFVLARGPVQITDGNGQGYVAQNNLVEKSSYPVQDVYDIVADRDPELAGKLCLSGLSTPLKAKKRVELKGLLEQYKLITPGTRFGFKELIDADDEENSAE